MQRYIIISLLLSGLSFSAQISPAEEDGQQDETRRREYLAALEALKAGKPARFRELSERLDGYVLRGYLEYESIKNRLAVTPAAEIRRFLAENSQAPISDVIRKKWLHLLAQRGDWSAFLKEHQ